MTNEEMWESNEPVCEFGIDQPDWIEGDLTPYDVAAICQGGCASGAYMPAVTYYTAAQTMAKHGDDVLQYIDDHYGEPINPPEGSSWAGISVFYLSVAVELWANMAESELEQVAA